MEIVDVGPFKVIRELPSDTKLMCAWGALWSFGSRYQVDNRYVDPIAIIDNGAFRILYDDPVSTLARPTTEIALVIEIRAMGKAERTSQKTFPAQRTKVVGKSTGDAWVISEDEWYHSSKRVGQVSVDLNSKKSFKFADLLGEAPFKSLVSTLKSKVRKL